MTDHLTIHCAQAPADVLNVETLRHFVYLETDAEVYGGKPCIALNRQSAQELYDLLGEFLADDQR